MYLCRYETYLRNYKKFIRPGACDLLICDEAHRLKNDATMTSRSLALLPTRRRMLLSGTPMQNDLTEFFAMVDFINPGVLRDVAYFRRHFERPILAGREPDASDTQQTRGEARSEELSTIVNEFILRRTNELLSAHLPPKLVQIVCCKLSTLQQLVYLHFVDVMDGGGSGTSTLGAILSLKKLCNHPKLVYDAINGYDQEASKAMACFKECVDIFPPCFSSGRGQRTDFAALIDFSGKFAVLDRLLFHLREHTKDRIVIVSNYTQTLDLMQALCRTRNYPCLRLGEYSMLWSPATRRATMAWCKQ
jgi:DNA repair and recombination RAD54-like protein